MNAQGPAAPPGPEFVPGELIVQFRRATTTTRRDAIISARAARLMRRYGQLDMDRLQLSAGTDLDQAMAALRANPEVVGVSANFVRHAITAGPPNDPFWLSSQMWGLIKIQAQSVWNTLGARGDGSVVIMDIDTGVNYNHEDLAANIWTNPNEIASDGIDNDGDGYIDDVHGINTIGGAAHPGDPLDDEGHGTHTAGTLAAVGNNGVGVVGVNWNAKIIACKFLDSTGSGDDGDAIECLNYAVTLKTLHNINIRVTSNSWGGRRFSGPVPTMLQAAFDAAGNAGILNIVAAGNNGFNIEASGNAFDPASLAATSPSMIAVASTGQTDALSSFSNWGPNTVMLAAPGEGIISTYFDPTHPANNTYASADGTSMATPHVAGTAALLSSMDPSLTNLQIKALIQQSVDTVGALGSKVITGGRLNAFGAASAVGGSTNHPPSATLTAPPDQSMYTALATIPMAATATDPDSGDTIDHVTFYANGSSIGSVSVPQAGVYNFSWTNVAAGSYTLTATATDNHGLTGAASNARQVTVNPGGGGGGLPAPWTAQDIGSVGAAGSASASAGTFTVKGAGADIWDTADAFQFVYQPLTGDGQIIARVVSLQNTNAWAKAGVMIRQDLTPGAANGLLAVTAANGVSFQRRFTPGGFSTYNAVAGGAPKWLRLTRTGTTLTASQSPDGATWTTVGTDTVSMSGTMYIGMAVTSHTAGVLTTGVFDNVTVTVSGGNQPPTAVLTGPPNQSMYAAPATVPITATASDPDSGDTIDHVTFYANGSPIGNVTTPQAGVYNFSWTNVAAGSYTLTATATDNHGLTGQPSAGRQISVNPAGGGGVPPPWFAQDIGSVGAAGTSSASNGTFTVQGSGADIWDTADAFQFVYQPLTGDGQIIARVVSLQNTNVWAKAGVMIRQDLTPGAANGLLAVTAGNGVSFQRRFTANGFSTYNAVAGAAPKWLRLTRSGSTLTASQSADGATWTTVGTDTVSMSGTMYIGLAVTSHSAGVLTTGVFDNVTVTVSGGNQPPTAVLTGPPNQSTYTAPATVPMTATASDPDSGDTIDHVTFYANGSPIGNVTTPQAGFYNLSWVGVAAGSYTLTATATDNHGLTGQPSAGRQITVNPAGGGGVPPPWFPQDIGTVGASGTASASNGTFTVQGSGADIWDTADAFQFVYQSLSGDGQIVARVVSVQNTNVWAKAGVMIRQDLTPGAANAMVAVTPGNGVSFQRRVTAGSFSTYNASPGTAPKWIRLVRAGSTITASQSNDGATWTTVGTDTVPMTGTVYIGLAVTSHSQGVLTTGVFDNVTVTGGS